MLAAARETIGEVDESPREHQPAILERLVGGLVSISVLLFANRPVRLYGSKLGFLRMLLVA